MEKEISYSHIFRLVWPAFFTFLGSSLMGFIDLLFVGHFGTIEVAAVSLANLFFTVLNTMFDGLRGGTAIFISKYLGAKDNGKVAETIKLSFLATMVISFIILLFSLPIAKLCYSSIKNEAIANVGIPYLTFRLATAPFSFFVLWANGVCQGWKNTRLPLMIMGLIFLLKISSMCLFNFLDFRLEGVSWATFIAYLLASIVYVISFLCKKEFCSFLFFKEKFSSLWKEYFSMSWKQGAFSSCSLYALIFFFHMMEALGINAMAAHQITYQVFLLFYLPSMGFLVSVSVLTARLLGAKAFGCISLLVRRVLWLGLGIIGVVSFFVIVFSHFIIQWICPGNQSVFDISCITLKLVGAALIFEMIYLVFRGTLIALGDNGFVLVLCLICDFVFFLPLAYFFSFSLRLSVIGGYIGYLLWAMASASILFLRFYQLLRKTSNFSRLELR